MKLKPDQNKILDYTSHLSKCGVGLTLIDVGCGSQDLLHCLPQHKKYVGIDSEPAYGYEDQTVKLNVEDPFFTTFDAETVVMFNVLDNWLDFDLACQNMKKVATKNIIVLTDLSKLTLEDFDRNFSDWNNTVREEISPKVWLLNYNKL